MIEVLLAIAAFIATIGILVTFHEYGHFIVARRLGFKVLRFSVGFGKPFYKWKGRTPVRVSGPGAPDPVPTEYWLSSIPLGGYVKLLDEREGPVPDAERHMAFNRRPIPHRIAVLAAGPGFNFLLAIAAYWLMFVTGVPSLKAFVGDITPDSTAEQAGLVEYDEILAVGGQPTPTLEAVTLGILDELLSDGRIDMTVEGADGQARAVELDVRGRESELTEPESLWSGLGFSPGPLPPVIGELTPDGPAERAGFLRGDRLLSADNEPIDNWATWVEFIRARPDTTVSVLVQRDGRERRLTLAIGSVRIQRDGQEPNQVLEVGSEAQEVQEVQVIGRIGAGLDLYVEQRYGVIESIPRGMAKTWEMGALTLRMLGRMVVGDVSVRNISGPITIAAFAGDSARAGLTAILGFLAIVSISLGILNLLPVPLLDGGQIVYQVVEWIKGSPISERSLIIGQQLGLVMLFVLMSFAFYNDLSRIFGS